MPDRRDLVVVGAGPAGLSAALAAADAGVDVTLLDAGASPGGQIWRQPAASGSGRAGGKAGRALRAAAGHPRIELVTGATVGMAMPVADLPAGPARPGRSAHPAGPTCPGRSAPSAGPARPGGGARLLVERSGRGWTVEARTVVLATGASELSLPFPGWDLPGVFTPGGAQALLKAHGVLAGSRILVAGTGPFLWPVAAGLCRAGARVVAVVDAVNPSAAGGRLAGLAAHPALLGQAAGYLRTLAAARVPVLGGRAVVAAHGRDRVGSVTVARLGDRGQPGPDRREYRVDAACAGWGFVPSVELARSLGCAEDGHPARPGSAVAVDADQATSVPGVYAAGETTGIGGATVSWWEGALAGASAARALGAVPDAGRVRLARRRLRYARHAARILDRGFPPPPDWSAWLTPDTVICRCEEVTWRRIADALDEGCTDLRTVKGQTRCGMGWCQGRVCGPAAQLAVARRLGLPPGAVGDLATRPLAAPIPIGLLADADIATDADAAADADTATDADTDAAASAAPAAGGG